MNKIESPSFEAKIQRMRRIHCVPLLVKPSIMNFAAHLNHPLFKTIGQIADENGQPAFAIGGFVRDL